MRSFQKIQESAEFLSSKIGFVPDIAIILGSGLSGMSDLLEDAKEISYSDIPYFPLSTVPGHAGKLISGKRHGKKVIAMKGRFHFYEGYTMNEVASPIRVLRSMGVTNLIVTNAAGGINKSFKPGDIMMIKDHIKFFSDTPLRGKNMEQFGPRFNDMSAAYTKELHILAKEAASETGLDLKEGVYAFMPGPSYETPAEIRMLSVLGADAVGMSTVPEVITGAHAGMKILGLSCISNMAAGILDKPLSHLEVIETAELVKDKFMNLLDTIIKNFVID